MQSLSSSPIIGSPPETAEETKSFHRDFQKDTSYLIVGAGDDNCKEFDLEMLSGGKLIAKDEEKNATPVLPIEIKAKARGTVKMIMHEYGFLLPKRWQILAS